MLKHNLEALQTGTKVVVDDMSSVLFGGVVGKSGEVVSLKRVVEDGDVDFHLWNPTTDESVYLASHEYQYVRVVEPVYISDTTSEEDMEFKTGDIVKVLGENTEEFTGDHGYPVGTELMVLKYDQSDDTYYCFNLGTSCVFKWVEADKLVKQDTPEEPLANLDKSEKLMMEYPEGTRVRYLGEPNIYYNQGEVYSMGTDRCDDYGVLDEEGEVFSIGCIREVDRMRTYEGFNPEVWEIVEEYNTLIEDYPAGTKVKYISEDPSMYKTGKAYTIGESIGGDYGVINDDGHVLSTGCIRKGSKSILAGEMFNPEDWEVVKDEVDVSTLKERYPVGTKVKYIGEESDDNSYVNGEVYQVGVDSYEDYGVLDEAGYVISPGCIQLGSHVLEGALFEPKDWEIVEEVKPMTAVASVEDLKERYPQGTKVVYVGNVANWRYVKGQAYTVGYDDFGDYGVRDENGLVLVTGIMETTHEGWDVDFEPTDWMIVEEVVQEEVKESTEDKDPEYQEAIEFLRNLSKSLNVVLEKLDK